MVAITRRLKKRVTDWLVQERGAASTPLFDFEQVSASLRPGDVLLVEGRSRVSMIIRHITHSPWTHSAIYVGTKDEVERLGLTHKVKDAYSGPSHEPLMVESLLGEGTILAPVSKYQDNHLRICRPIGLPEADRREVVARMLDRLGTEYNVRELLESAFVLLSERLAPHRRSRYFDAKVQRSEVTICSSMLGQAFMSVGFPVLPLFVRTREGEKHKALRAFQMLTPKDFDQSPTFEIIKCPVDSALRQALVHGIETAEAEQPQGKAPSRKPAIRWVVPHWLRRLRGGRARANTSLPKTDTGPSE